MGKADIVEIESLLSHIIIAKLKKKNPNFEFF